MYVWASYCLVSHAKAWHCVSWDMKSQLPDFRPCLTHRSELSIGGVNSPRHCSLLEKDKFHWLRKCVVPDLKSSHAQAKRTFHAKRLKHFFRIFLVYKKKSLKAVTKILSILSTECSGFLSVSHKMNSLSCLSINTSTAWPPISHITRHDSTLSLFLKRQFCLWHLGNRVSK